jgi:predicted methyltransferase
MRLWWPLAVVAALGLGASTASSHAQRAVQTTAPEDLGILESPDRDQWQQPEEIMDALGIADGSRVADLGAGGGWFTVRLGHRVGPQGVVYAVDIQPEMIEVIMRRVGDHGLTWICPIRGTEDDPRLLAGMAQCPAKRPPQTGRTGLDAVLIVDTYPQFEHPVPLLRHVAAALAPTGRLGIVDFRKDGAGGPGPPLEERVDPGTIRRDAQQAGLVFLREETFLQYQFLLIFGKPAVSAPAGPAGARFGAGSTRPRRP